MLVDGGNLTDSPKKSDLILSVLGKLGYTAVGLGPLDIKPEVRQGILDAAASKGVAVLDPTANLGQSVSRHVVKQVNGVRVGVVSPGAETPAAGADDYEMRKSFYGAYKAAREASDVLVVLDSGGLIKDELLGKIGARYGEPDIVIGGLNSIALSNVRMVGRTHMAPVFMQAKSVGVFDVTVEKGAAPKITWSKVSLEETYPEDTAVKAQIDQFLKSPGGQPAAGATSVH